VNQQSDGDAAREALASLQPEAFENAKRAVDVARIILAGDDAGPDGLGTPDADQATRVPSSETVQKPAGE
jgi:hypothetical protein